MAVSLATQISSLNVSANPAPQSSRTRKVKAHEVHDAIDASNASQAKTETHARSSIDTCLTSLCPSRLSRSSRTATRRFAQTLTRGLAAANLWSAGMGAAVTRPDQRVLSGPAALTPGEDMFKAYLGDWRCVTYGPASTGDAWTKFTTPPSWYPNAVRIWWDDLDSEWREGFLVDLDPVDATHGKGDGPWLRKRYDNNVLPTWGSTDLSAEKTEDGWNWIADVKLRDSDAHWIEFHEDTFSPEGVSFSRDRRVHHVDENWWQNDTVLCTLLPAGPRAEGLQDEKKMVEMAFTKWREEGGNPSRLAA